MESVAIPEEMIRRYEKRRSGRDAFVCKGLLYHGSQVGRPLCVTLKDISQLGVGFETTRPLETGAECRVKIELGPTRIAWGLRVVCCGKIDENLYRVGCEFLPFEALFDLGDVQFDGQEQVAAVQ